MSKTIFKDKSNILIIVLVLVALGLGVAIYLKNGGRLPTLLSSKPSVIKSTSPAPSANKLRRPTPTGLTEEEKKLLNPPRPGSSEEDRKKHYDLVVKISQRAEVLNLNSCSKPSPLALRVSEGKEFKVRNSDSQDHTIVIDKDHEYTIKANSDSAIKAEFGRGKGSYGYLCDNMSGVVGFFFVIP